MSMQDKILAEIRKRIEAGGLEYVHNPQWGNTGIVYAQQDFTVRFAFYYGFYDGYANLSFTGDAVEKVAEEYDLGAYGLRPGGGHRDLPKGPCWTNHKLSYGDGREIEATLRLIELLAPAQSQPQSEPAPEPPPVSNADIDAAIEDILNGAERMGVDLRSTLDISDATFEALQARSAGRDVSPNHVDDEELPNSDVSISATISIFEGEGKHWLLITGEMFGPFNTEDQALDAIPEALRGME